MAKGKEVTVEASLLKRFAAFVIDLVVLDFVFTIPLKPLLKDVSAERLVDILQTGSPSLVKAGMLMSFTALLYFMILEYKIGQTVGKLLMNIYVENELQEKKFWQYFMRSLYFIPVLPFSLFWIIDPLYILFTRKSKRLSEVLSRTKTVAKVVI